MTARTAVLLALAALAAAPLAGCRRDPPPPLPGDDDGDDDADPVDGLFGAIHVVEDGEALRVHGVFARDLPAVGLIDGLAGIGVVDPSFGYWTPPGSDGEMVPVDELVADWRWTEDRFYDAGPVLTAAGVEADRVDEWLDADGFVLQGPAVYLGEAAADLDTLPALGLAWPGGADLPAGQLADAMAVLPAPAWTSHDPAETVRWVEGSDLELAWSVDDGGEVLLTLAGDRRWYQARVPAAGALTVPAEVLHEAIVVEGEVHLARTGVAEQPAAAGAVQVRQSRVRSLALAYSGVLRFEPDRVFLDSTAELTVTHLDGTFVDGETTFDLGPGVEVLSVVVPGGAGEVAQLQVAVAGEAETGPRDVTAEIAGTPVDSARALHVLLPQAERCEEAYLLDEGRYHGDLAGMADDHDDPSACTGYLAEGPDAAYQLLVPENAIIALYLWVEDADAVLYLVHDCGEVSQPLACSDDGGLGVPEELSLAPLPGQAGWYRVIVDSFGELPEGAGAFTLDVDLIGY